MVLNQIDPKPTLEEDYDDNSTAYSARTPPSTIAADPPDDFDPVKDSFKPSSSTSSLVPSTIAADPDPLDDDDDDPKLSRSFNSSSSSSSSPSSFSLVPWPKSTFVIRCVSSGRAITLLEGQITFTTLPPRGRHHHGGGGGGGGSVHWACMESNGWLGFLNIVSGRFLGHDSKGKLCCSAARHRRWEHFCVRKRPQGGYVLLMRHYDGVCCVGVKKEEEQGRVVEKLAKLEDAAAAGSSTGGIVWEFGEGLGL